MLEYTLSIIIPCKNEGPNIYDCLGFISKQRCISGINVIIADNSDDEESLRWIEQARKDYSKLLNIKVIKGGYPAKARLEGSRIAKTPYMLFLDADIMLIDNNTVINCYEKLLASDKDLLTLPFKTERGWDWVFRIFDVVQWLSHTTGTPFAVGGFQLFKTEAYWGAGGYIEDELFAEDYSLSSKIKADKFMVYKFYGAWTSARRFKKKGIFFMMKIMIKSYLNRNNPEFFKKSHNYWN